MKRYLMVAVIAVFLLGCFQGKANLRIEAAAPSGTYYVGDVLVFNVTVYNTGSVEAEGVPVDFLVDGVSLDERIVHLQPEGKEVLEFRWFPTRNGTFEISIVVDHANIIDEEVEDDNYFKKDVQILPGGEIDVLQHVPDGNISSLYKLDLTREGSEMLLAIFLSGNHEGEELFNMVKGRVRQAQMAYALYDDSSDAIVIATRAAFEEEEFFGSLSDWLNKYEISNNHILKDVEGRMVHLYANDNETLCLWKEEGVYRIAFRKGGSCDEEMMMERNASRFQGILNKTIRMSQPVVVNPSDTGLAEMRGISDESGIYALALKDNNSAFLLFITNQSGFTQDRCRGELIKEGDRTLCYLRKATLAGRINLTAYVRKQGDDYISIFILPFSHTDMRRAEDKAKEMVKSVDFGLQDYNWIPEPLSYCAFQSLFQCSDFSYTNSTLHLNLTLRNNHSVIINGFKCTDENEIPKENFALSSPLNLTYGNSVMLEYPCYIGNTTHIVQGDALFLQKKLYINVTNLDTNETGIVKGSLRIIR